MLWRRRGPWTTLLLGAPILVALSLASVSTGAADAASAQPSAGVVAAAATTPIKHVVVILKENRSYDEYFGRYPGADGATTALMSNGKRVRLAHTPDSLPNDISHSPASFKIAYDNGKMDGFNKETGAYSSSGQPLALSQMHQSDIPAYWAYANHYAMADHFFAAWKGASFTNHLMTMAAQAGQYDPSLGGRSVYWNPFSPSVRKLGTSSTPWWGCDDPPDTTVPMINDTTGALSKMFPCFDFRSMPNILSRHGLSWHMYSTPGVQSIHDALDALKPVRYNPSLWSQVVPVGHFESDALAGKLPAVSWVIGGAQEHPPASVCAGENQSVGYVNSVMKGPDWKSTVIFIMYDEWGGFYDHVKPPQPNVISYGFRVPFMVISPYTKHGSGSHGGYVSSTLYSQPSVLKFIEDNWKLPSLTPVDAHANDLMDMFNFSGPLKPKLILGQRSCPVTKLTPAQQAIANSD